MTTKQILCLLVLFAAESIAYGQDWPQWRGPDRTGRISSNVHFSSDSKFERKWKAEIGTGFSSPVISDGILVCMGNINDEDQISALDAATGQQLWEFRYPAPLDPNLFEGGPTSTPSIHENKVVCLSRQGLVHCLDLKTGSLVWKYDIKNELEFNIPTWGYSGSPLIRGGNVFLNAGSHGVCLSLKDAGLVWSSSNDEDAGYSSPVISKQNDREILLLMSAKALNAVAPEDGELLFSQRWITRYGINAADPICLPGNQVLVSSGYGKGTGLIEFHESKSDLVWRTRDIRTQMSAGVLVNNNVFAFDGDEGDEPRLVSYSAETGELNWAEDEFGTGSLIAVNNQILALGQDGTLTIFPPSSQEFQPILQAKLSSGKHWTPPVLVGNSLYLRNAIGSITCLHVQ